MNSGMKIYGQDIINYKLELIFKRTMEFQKYILSLCKKLNLVDKRFI